LASSSGRELISLDVPREYLIEVLNETLIVEDIDLKISLEGREE
jgi:hypothetical protein